MVIYPIHVKRFGYRGADRRKREKASEHNRIASELETYINGLLKVQESPVQSYLYYQIAAATGYSEEVVRELCFSIDCGHNGFTAIRSGLAFEQAMELSQRGDCANRPRGYRPHLAQHINRAVSRIKPRETAHFRR